jgi:GT2 family glycosyltransferase
MNHTAIIMSVYKNDKLPYLKEALDSLYNQTKKADIFIQLDGRVPLEIERFLDEELERKKIAYLGKREQNIGLAGSLNELLEVVLAKGYPYIARMDADDISVPERIAKQVDFLDKHPEISAVGGWIEEFNVDTGERQIVQYGESHEALKQNLLKRNPLAHVTICFRNTFFDTISCYDTTKLNEDFDLWIKAFKKDIQLHCLQEVLVKVRTSNAFFDRRKNITRAKEVMLLKFDATRAFGFGIKGYLYAVAHFVLFLSPGWMKRYLYKKMRK